MKKKKQEILYGNPERNMELFNQAVTTNFSGCSMGEAIESLNELDNPEPRNEFEKEILEDGYLKLDYEDACDALRNDYVSDLAMVKHYIRENGKLLDYITDKFAIISFNDIDEELATKIIDDVLYDICPELDKSFLMDFIISIYED